MIWDIVKNSSWTTSPSTSELESEAQVPCELLIQEFFELGPTPPALFAKNKTLRQLYFAKNKIESLC